MSAAPKSHGRVVASALIGLTLGAGGLLLAALSNPKRFSINVAEDRYIQLFAISGFLCTAVGVFLFLYAVRDTTETMSPKLQSRVNTGIGLGFVLQLAGLFLPGIMQIRFEVSLALLLAGLPAFVWGGMHYAQGKGHPRSLGLLAVLGILGLIVLILLPHRELEIADREGT